MSPFRHGYVTDTCVFRGYARSGRRVDLHPHPWVGTRAHARVNITKALASSLTKSLASSRPAAPGSGPRPRTAASPRPATGRPAERSRPTRRAPRPARARRSSALPPPSAATVPRGAPRRRPPPPEQPARRGRSALSRPRRRSRTGPRPSAERSLLQLLLLLAGADLGLHLRQLVVDLRLRGELPELAVELRLVGGEVLESARGRELVDCRRAGLHLLLLVLRPLNRQPGVGHLLPDPRRGLADPNLGLGSGVLRLDRLLLRPERLDLGRKRLPARDELLLLLLELLGLLVETLQLLLETRLPLERLAREILPARPQSLSRLRVELDDALLQLRLLQFEPLLRGDHVGDPALDVLEQLELPLVRVVQRLRRVLGPVEQLRELRLHDHRRA